MIQFHQCLISTMLLSCVIGCGAAANQGVTSNPDEVVVSGMVLYQGQPVQIGQVTFRSTDNPEITESAAIEGGMYSISTSIGPKRVEITGDKIIQETDSQTKEQSVTKLPLIPDQYGAASTLTADIQPDTNQLTFDLK